MKFQWYIINLEEGTVVGTNDVELAQPFINNDDYLLLTAQHGRYYLGSNTENEVQELNTTEDNDDFPEDEDQN